MERAHAAAIIAAIIWHRRGGADAYAEYLVEAFNLIEVAERVDEVPEISADQLEQLADAVAIDRRRAASPRRHSAGDPFPP